MGGSKGAKAVRWRFWKRSEPKAEAQRGTESAVHRELDPEIEVTPELDHGILIGLIGDSDRLSDEKYIRGKYGLTPVHLREYMHFLSSKGLLRISLRRDGKIGRVEVTEKGRQFIMDSEAHHRAQETTRKQGAPSDIRS